MRRVVVTGLGAVSPLGIGVGPTWEAMVAGRSGVGPITSFDASGLPVRIAAECRDFDGVEVFGKRKARHLDRFAQLAIVAAREAIAHAGVEPSIRGSERAGVVWGAGIGGIQTMEAEVLLMAERGADRVSPYLCPKMIPNMAPGEIAMEYGLRGPNVCTVTACAASANAIGDAADQIRLGRAEVMVAGGSEASINPITMAGFAAMKALSERNDDPGRASRPFDAERDGFVCGEGAAALVLEDRDHALARGAEVLAELVGYGLTCDAHHMTAPHPEADGAIRAMRMAIADLEAAGLGVGDVGYVNAHGTSTPPNDRTETLAVRTVLGGGVPVSSTKSMTGHLLGAAGALEAVASVQVLRTGVLPPTVNLEHPDPECDLDYVPNAAREVAGGVRAVLTNSFGFGGHNVTLALATLP